MRILIVYDDYAEFTRGLYAGAPGLELKSFAEQQEARRAALFGGAGFYAKAFAELGHEGIEISANNYAMQAAWMREQGLPVPPEFARQWGLYLRNGWLPWPVHRRLRPWRLKILMEQMRRLRPDVVLNQAMDTMEPAFLREARPLARVLIGQHAPLPMPLQPEFKYYDLCISSFPPMVDWYREHGMRGAFLRLGFSPEILGYLPAAMEKKYRVSHIGSLFNMHAARRELLLELAKRIELDLWGPADIGEIPELARFYRGRAYGRKMFEILMQSCLTLNHHGSVPPFANNFRLYEATGVGTCLVTDWKQNLHEMFEPEREVVTYREPRECAEKIGHFLERADEREQIARAGQRRTLAEHSQRDRMAELIEMVKKIM